MLLTANSKLLVSVLTASICYSCSNQNNRQNGNDLPKVQTMESPSKGSASLPYLTTGPDQELYMSWVETAGDTAVFKYASMDQSEWSVPEEIARGTDWFVNWADYPMIAVNGSGAMTAHFLTSSGEAYFAYDVNIVRKPVTQAWSDTLVPHRDGTTTEHGFVTMLPMANSSFQLAWLDGRNTANEGHEHQGAMTLRGALMDMNGNLSEEVELDNHVCDCCQTGGAITDNGPVVVYRDRSEQEVRDIAIVRQVNGNWTSPQIVFEDHWKIAGCPVNGPRADAIGNNLGIAWFAAPNNKPEVKVIFSSDGGENFGDPVIIDNKYPIGRVDLVMLDNKRAMISWLCKEGEQTLIKAQVVHQSGQVEPSIVVAESNEVRGSGFPQMAKIDEVVYFAWTKVSSEDQSTVKLAVLK